MSVKSQIIMSCCRNGAHLLNGYEDALVGVTSDQLPVYGYTKLVEVVRKTLGFEKGRAMAYVDSSIIASLSAGNGAGPIILYPYDEKASFSADDDSGTSLVDAAQGILPI